MEKIFPNNVFIKDFTANHCKVILSRTEFEEDFKRMIDDNKEKEIQQEVSQETNRRRTAEKIEGNKVAALTQYDHVFSSNQDLG